ncbi:uncharacterized protein IWZ02DRAFT_315105 [Phyllosticta citriasiana]|uniref:uncharacterized protein n=1 Tax=Phyllosticta citriasiana TaxID=595635 RepID=UPI0030FDA487
MSPRALIELSPCLVACWTAFGLIQLCNRNFGQVRGTCLSSDIATAWMSDAVPEFSLHQVSQYGRCNCSAVALWLSLRSRTPRRFLRGVGHHKA